MLFEQSLANGQCKDNFHPLSPLEYLLSLYESFSVEYWVLYDQLLANGQCSKGFEPVSSHEYPWRPSNFLTEIVRVSYHSSPGPI